MWIIRPVNNRSVFSVSAGHTTWRMLLSSQTVMTFLISCKNEYLEYIKITVVYIVIIIFVYILQEFLFFFLFYI